jgi:hypothetical protein
MPSLLDYVHGQAKNSRAWVNETVREMIGIDSLVAQEEPVRARLAPKRFGGGFISAQSMLNFMAALGYGTTAAAGFGTVGFLTGNYAPWLVQELKFNGQAPLGGGGNIGPDRVLDAAGAYSVSRVATPISWGTSWDWLKGRTGIMRGLYVGTGTTPVTNLGQMVRTGAAANLGGISPAIPSGALGTVFSVETAFDASAISTADDVYPTLLFKTATAPTANSVVSVIGYWIEADDNSALDPRPHYACFYAGIGGQRLADFQNPAKFNQDGRSKLIQLAAITDYVIAAGMNDAVLATINSSAEFLAYLEAERTMAKRYSPKLRIRCESPHTCSEALRPRLNYVRQAMLDFANAHDDVTYVDLGGYFNNPAALIPYEQVDQEHWTQYEGQVLKCQTIYQAILAHAATVTDVNVVTVKGRDAIEANPVIFDGVTAGGSTETTIILADAYDPAKGPAFIGNVLIADAVGTLPARITGYSNPGSGASAVTVEAGSFDSGLEAGVSVRIVVAGQGTWATPDDVPTTSTIANALAGATNINAVGIVSGQVMEIVRGNRYTLADNRAWRFKKQAGEPWPADLTGHTIRFTANRSKDNTATGSQTGSASLTLDGTILTAAGEEQEVYFEPGTDRTGLFAIGVGAKGYYWDVVAIQGIDHKTLRLGVMTVRENQTPLG